MHQNEEDGVELVNGVLDGEATEQQRQELNRLLVRSPKTKTLFEDIRQVTRRLDAMPRVEPPADLKSSVLSEIRSRPPVFATARFGTRRRVTFAALWAAAASFVLLVVLMDPLEMRSRQSRTGAAATMAPADALQWPVVARFPHLMVRQRGNLYSVEPLVEAQMPVVVQWDTRQLVLVGVSGGTDVASTPSQTRLTVRYPDRAAVVLRRSAVSGTAEIRLGVGDQLFTAHFVVTD